MRDPNPEPHRNSWNNLRDILTEIILEETCVHWGNSTLIPSTVLALKELLELVQTYNSPSQRKTLFPSTSLSKNDIKEFLADPTGSAGKRIAILILRIQKHLGQISGDILNNNPPNPNYRHSGGRPNL